MDDTFDLKSSYLSKAKQIVDDKNQRTKDEIFSGFSVPSNIDDISTSQSCECDETNDNFDDYISMLNMEDSQDSHQDISSRLQDVSRAIGNLLAEENNVSAVSWAPMQDQRNAVTPSTDSKTDSATRPFTGGSGPRSNPSKRGSNSGSWETPSFVRRLAVEPSTSYPSSAKRSGLKDNSALLNSQDSATPSVLRAARATLDSVLSSPTLSKSVVEPQASRRGAAFSLGQIPEIAESPENQEVEHLFDGRVGTISWAVDRSQEMQNEMIKLKLKLSQRESEIASLKDIKLFGLAEKMDIEGLKEELKRNEMYVEGLKKELAKDKSALNSAYKQISSLERQLQELTKDYGTQQASQRSEIEHTVAALKSENVRLRQGADLARQLETQLSSFKNELKTWVSGNAAESQHFSDLLASFEIEEDPLPLEGLLKALQGLATESMAGEKNAETNQYALRRKDQEKEDFKSQVSSLEMKLRCTQEELSAAKSSLAIKENEAQELRKSNRRQREEIEYRDADLNKGRKQIAEISQKLQSKDSQASASEQQNRLKINKLEDQIHELFQKLHASEQSCIAADSEAKKWERQAQASESQLNEWKEKARGNDLELKKAQKNVTELSQEMEDLHGRMEATAAKINQENDRLLQESAQARESLENANQQLEQCREKLRTQRSECLGAEEKSRQLRAELLAAQNEVNSMRRERENADREYQSIKSQLQEKENAEAKLRSDLSLLQNTEGKLKQNRADLHAAQTETTNLRRELARIKTENQILETKLQEKKTNEDELCLKVSSLKDTEGALRQCRADLLSAQSDVATLQREIQGKRSHQQVLEAKVQEAKCAEEKFRTELALVQDSQGKLRQCRADLLAMQADSVALKRQMEGLREHNKSLEAKLHDKVCAEEGLRSEVALLKSIENELRLEAESWEDSEKKMSRLQGEIQDLQSRLHQATQKEKETTQNLLNQGGKVASLQSEIEGMNEMVHRKDLQIANMNSEISSLNRQLHLAQDGSGKQENQLNSLRDEINTLRAKLRESSMEKELVSGDLAKVKDELASARSSWAVAEDGLRTVKEQLTGNKVQQGKLENQLKKTLAEEKKRQEMIEKGLREQLQQIQCEKDSLGSQLEELRSETERLKLKLQHAADNEQRMQQHAVDLQAREEKIQTLEAEIIPSRDEINQLQEERAEMFRSLKELEIQKIAWLTKEKQLISELEGVKTLREERNAFELQLAETKSDLQAKIQELHAQLSEINESFILTKNSLSSVTQELKEKEMMLSSYDQHRKDVQTDFDSLLEQRNIVQTNLSNAQQTIQQLQFDIESVKQQRMKMQGILVSKTEQAGQMARDLEQSKQELGSLRGDNAHLEQQLAQERTFTRNTSHQLKELESKVGVFSQEIEQLTKSKSAVEKQLQEKVKSNNKQKEDLEEIISALETQNKNLQQDISDSTRKLSMAHNELQTLKSSQSQTSLEVDKYFNQVLDLQQTLASKNSIIDDINKKVHFLEEGRKQMQMKIDDLTEKEESLFDMKQEMPLLQSQLEFSQKQLALKKTEAEELQKQVELSNALAASAQSQLDKEEGNSQSLEKGLINAQQMLKTQQNRVTELQEMVSSKNNDIVSMKEQLLKQQDVRDRLAEQEVQTSALKVENQEMEKKLSEALAACNQKEDEVHHLKMAAIQHSDTLRSKEGELKSIRQNEKKLRDQLTGMTETMQDHDYERAQDLASKEQALSTANLEIQNLKSQVKTDQQSYSHLQSKVKDLEAERATLQSAKLSIEDYLRDWSLMIHQDILSDLQRTLNEVVAKRDRAKDLSSLQQSTLSLRPSVARVEMESYLEVGISIEEKVSRMLQVVRRMLQDLKKEFYTTEKTMEFEANKLRKALQSKEFHIKEMESNHQSVLETQKRLLNHETERLEPKIRELHALKSENMKLKSELRDLNLAQVAREGDRFGSTHQEDFLMISKLRSKLQSAMDKIDRQSSELALYTQTIASKEREIARLEKQLTFPRSEQEGKDLNFGNVGKVQRSPRNIASSVYEDQRTLSVQRRRIAELEAQISSIRNRVRSAVSTVDGLQHLKGKSRLATTSAEDGSWSKQSLDAQAEEAEDLLFSQIHEIAGIAQGGDYSLMDQSPLLKGKGESILSVITPERPVEDSMRAKVAQLDGQLGAMRAQVKAAMETALDVKSLFQGQKKSPVRGSSWSSQERSLLGLVHDVKEIEDVIISKLDGDSKTERSKTSQPSNSGATEIVNDTAVYMTPSRQKNRGRSPTRSRSLSPSRKGSKGFASDQWFGLRMNDTNPLEYDDSADSKAVAYWKNRAEELGQVIVSYKTKLQLWQKQMASSLQDTILPQSHPECCEQVLNLKEEVKSKDREIRVLEQQRAQAVDKMLASLSTGNKEDDPFTEKVETASSADQSGGSVTSEHPSAAQPARPSAGKGWRQDPADSHAKIFSEDMVKKLVKTLQSYKHKYKTAKLELSDACGKADHLWDSTQAHMQNFTKVTPATFQDKASQKGMQNINLSIEKLGSTIQMLLLLLHQQNQLNSSQGQSNEHLNSKNQPGALSLQQGDLRGVDHYLPLPSRMNDANDVTDEKPCYVSDYGQNLFGYDHRKSRSVHESLDSNSFTTEMWKRGKQIES